MELSKKFFFEMDSYTEYAPNTFIGGIGATENSASALALRLGIPESYIKNFKVTGDNVSFYTNNFWSPQQSAFYQKTDLTYFYDLSEKGLETIVDIRVFQQNSSAVNLKYLYLKNSKNIPSNTFVFTKSLLNAYFEKLESIGVAQTFRDFGAKNLRLPNLINLSSDNMLQEASSQPNRLRLYAPRLNVRMEQSSANTIFTPWSSGKILYTHPDMATADSGSPHPSVAAVISVGGVVRYVSNFTPPTPITDLSVTPSFNSVTVNFTPSTAVNGMDFYEVWLTEKNRFNPVQKFLPNDQELTASGQTITGLKVGTEYVLRLASCDTMYNGSGMSDTPAFSNEVIFKTL